MPEKTENITALMSEAIKGYINIAEALLEAGADVNLQNERGETALMKAAEYGHADNVDILLRTGANIDLQNNENKTAAMIAQARGFEEIFILINNYLARLP